MSRRRGRRGSDEDEEWLPPGGGGRARVARQAEEKDEEEKGEGEDELMEEHKGAAAADSPPVQHADDEGEEEEEDDEPPRNRPRYESPRDSSSSRSSRAAAEEEEEEEEQEDEDAIEPSASASDGGGESEEEGDDDDDGEEEEDLEHRPRRLDGRYVFCTCHAKGDGPFLGICCCRVDCSCRVAGVECSAAAGCYCKSRAAQNLNYRCGIIAPAPANAPAGTPSIFMATPRRPAGSSTRLRDVLARAATAERRAERRARGGGSARRAGGRRSNRARRAPAGEEGVVRQAPRRPSGGRAALVASDGPPAAASVSEQGAPSSPASQRALEEESALEAAGVALSGAMEESELQFFEQLSIGPQSPVASVAASERLAAGGDQPSSSQQQQQQQQQAAAMSLSSAAGRARSAEAFRVSQRFFSSVLNLRGFSARSRRIQQQSSLPASRELSASQLSTDDPFALPPSSQPPPPPLPPSRLLSSTRTQMAEAAAASRRATRRANPLPRARWPASRAEAATPVPETEAAPAAAATAAATAEPDVDSAAMDRFFHQGCFGGYRSPDHSAESDGEELTQILDSFRRESGHESLAGGAASRGAAGRGAKRSREQRGRDASLAQSAAAPASRSESTPPSHPPRVTRSSSAVAATAAASTTRGRTRQATQVQLFQQIEAAAVKVEHKEEEEEPAAAAAAAVASAVDAASPASSPSPPMCIRHACGRSLSPSGFLGSLCRECQQRADDNDVEFGFVSSLVRNMHVSQPSTRSDSSPSLLPPPPAAQLQQIQLPSDPQPPPPQQTQLREPLPQIEITIPSHFFSDDGDVSTSAPGRTIDINASHPGASVTVQVVDSDELLARQMQQQQRQQQLADDATLARNLQQQQQHQQHQQQQHQQPPPPAFAAGPGGPILHANVAIMSHLQRNSSVVMPALLEAARQEGFLPTARFQQLADTRRGVWARLVPQLLQVGVPAVPAAVDRFAHLVAQFRGYMVEWTAPQASGLNRSHVTNLLREVQAADSVGYAGPRYQEPFLNQLVADEAGLPSQDTLAFWILETVPQVNWLIQENWPTEVPSICSAPGARPSTAAAASGASRAEHVARVEGKEEEGKKEGASHTPAAAAVAAVATVALAVADTSAMEVDAPVQANASVPPVSPASGDAPTDMDMDDGESEDAQPRAATAATAVAPPPPPPPPPSPPSSPAAAAADEARSSPIAIAAAELSAAAVVAESSRVGAEEKKEEAVQQSAAMMSQGEEEQSEQKSTTRARRRLQVQHQQSAAAQPVDSSVREALDREDEPQPTTFDYLGIMRLLYDLIRRLIQQLPTRRHAIGVAASAAASGLEWSRIRTRLSELVVAVRTALSYRCEAASEWTRRVSLPYVEESGAGGIDHDLWHFNRLNPRLADCIQAAEYEFRSEPIERLFDSLGSMLYLLYRDVSLADGGAAAAAAARQGAGAAAAAAVVGQYEWADLLAQERGPLSSFRAFLAEPIFLVESLERSVEERAHAPVDPPPREYAELHPSNPPQQLQISLTHAQHRVRHHLLRITSEGATIDRVNHHLVGALQSLWHAVLRRHPSLIPQLEPALIEMHTVSLEQLTRSNVLLAPLYLLLQHYADETDDDDGDPAGRVERIQATAHQLLRASPLVNVEDPDVALLSGRNSSSRFTGASVFFLAPPHLERLQEPRAFSIADALEWMYTQITSESHPPVDASSTIAATPVQQLQQPAPSLSQGGSVAPSPFQDDLSQPHESSRAPSQLSLLSQQSQPSSQRSFIAPSPHEQKDDEAQPLQWSQSSVQSVAPSGQSVARPAAAAAAGASDDDEASLDVPYPLAFSNEAHAQWLLGRLRQLLSELPSHAELLASSSSSASASSTGRRFTRLHGQLSHITGLLYAAVGVVQRLNDPSGGFGSVDVEEYERLVCALLDCGQAEWSWTRAGSAYTHGHSLPMTIGSLLYLFFALMQEVARSDALPDLTAMGVPEFGVMMNIAPLNGLDSLRDTPLSNQPAAADALSQARESSPLNWALAQIQHNTLHHLAASALNSHPRVHELVQQLAAGAAADPTPLLDELICIMRTMFLDGHLTRRVLPDLVPALVAAARLVHSTAILNVQPVADRWSVARVLYMLIAVRDIDSGARTRELAPGVAQELLQSPLFGQANSAELFAGMPLIPPAEVVSRFPRLSVWLQQRIHRFAQAAMEVRMPNLGPPPGQQQQQQQQPLPLPPLPPPPHHPLALYLPAPAPGEELPDDQRRCGYISMMTWIFRRARSLFSLLPRDHPPTPLREYTQPQIDGLNELLILIRAAFRYRVMHAQLVARADRRGEEPDLRASTVQALRAGEFEWRMLDLRFRRPLSIGSLYTSLHLSSLAHRRQNWLVVEDVGTPWQGYRTFEGPMASLVAFLRDPLWNDESAQEDAEASEREQNRVEDAVLLQADRQSAQAGVAVVRASRAALYRRSVLVQVRRWLRRDYGFHPLDMSPLYELLLELHDAYMFGYLILEYPELPDPIADFRAAAVRFNNNLPPNSLAGLLFHLMWVYYGGDARSPLAASRELRRLLVLRVARSHLINTESRGGSSSLIRWQSALGDPFAHAPVGRAGREAEFVGVDRHRRELTDAELRFVTYLADTFARLQHTSFGRRH